MDVANTFRDLNVYKLAAKSAAEIYEMARAFPKEELFSLADQIRGSSRATKAMIAEAWARRRYWRSIAAMRSRMIDRATDFCKHASDADYRLLEEPDEFDAEV